MRLSIVRLTAALVVACVAALAGASVALATTGTGNQNPDLLVSVSLSPDEVQRGDSVDASGSVTNQGPQTETVVVTATRTAPNGKSESSTETAMLAPGQSLARTYTVAVESGQRGTYTLTVSADDGSGASTATAQTVVTK
jgi:uncharacterized protein (DUF58 family)